MSKTNNSDVVAQLENALETVTLASWNRVRSTGEIESFLTRREIATADAEL